MTTYAWRHHGDPLDAPSDRLFTEVSGMSPVYFERDRIRTSSVPLALSPGDNWEVVSSASDWDGDAATLFREKGRERLIGRFADVRRYHRANEVGIIVAAESQSAASAILASIRLKVATVPEPDGDKINVRFFYRAPHGAQTRERVLADFHPWHAVRENYAAGAVEHLDRLMALTPADLLGGRLALLHGPAGTGKTTAVRALAQSWRSWCRTDYVIDPERFFGEADYMIEVLLSTAPDAEGVIDHRFSGDDLFAKDPDDDEEPVLAPRQKWRLIVVEDAEEFIAPDAKERIGQALARLLNVGDGLVGQGLQVLVLLTTNAPLGKLHPAITRPGRTFASIDVPKLSRTEADEWCERHGLDRDGRGERSLAELYETLRKNHETRMIGTGLELATTGGTYL